MKVRVFTLRLDPESGAFDDRALREFQEGRDLIDASEHLVTHGGTPVLAIVVRYTEPASPRSRRPDEEREDWRAELDDAGKVRYDELRLWRGRVARRDGLPPFLIFTNREMADVANRAPATLAALQEIDGVGEAKARRWGEEILAVITACMPPVAATEPDPVPPAQE